MKHVVLELEYQRGIAVPATPENLVAVGTFIAGQPVKWDGYDRKRIRFDDGNNISMFSAEIDDTILEANMQQRIDELEKRMSEANTARYAAERALKEYKEAHPEESTS